MNIFSRIKNEKQKFVATQFADKMASMQSLIDVGMINISGDKVELHDFLLKDKDATFVRNQITSISMYMIVKNNGEPLPFKVHRRSDQKLIGSCNADGDIVLFGH